MRRPPLPSRLTGLSAVLLALALVLACVPAARAQDDGPTREESLAREREQLTARLARLRDETAATEARAEVLGETLVDLAGDEARLRQRLDATAARIAELERGIAGDEAALDRLTGGQAAIRHELAARRRELATVLMALQRIGRRPPPALFVGKGGPTGVVRGAILLNAVIPTLDGEAQALARQMAEAARLAADEELRWQSLRGDLAELTDERERLNALVAELSRRRALSLYERDQASANLARLAAEASSVNALLSRLEEGTRDSGAPQGLAFASRRGGLPDPVAGAVIGEFGDRTEADGLSEGRIIAALPQSTVFAPMPATVLYAAPFRSYAHVLILDAGDGYHMVLTGLEESFVEAGSTVEAGTPIGRMGARRGRSAVVPVQNSRGSLTAERPLLYVELRRDGAAIDSHGWWRNPIPDGGRTSG